MRTSDGLWTIEVMVEGHALEEHIIDGHHCVQAQPGKDFEVKAEYLGGPDYFRAQLHIDGKPIGDSKSIDGVGDTKRARRSYTFLQWEKTQDGHRTKQTLRFERAAATASDEDSRPGVRDWSLGKFTLQVKQGERYTSKGGGTAANFKADVSKGHVDESTMVKSGLSTTAGAGAVSFTTVTTHRAGTVAVRSVANSPVLAEYSLFFRDSFFMALNDDTCCGGRCKGKAAQSLRARAEAEMAEAARAGSSELAQGMREGLVSTRETHEALSRKRPAAEEPIDLCDSDDD